MKSFVCSRPRSKKRGAPSIRLSSSFATLALNGGWRAIGSHGMWDADGCVCLVE